MSWDWASNEAAGLYHGAEHKLSAAGHEVEHFAEVAGVAALHSAIQDPIDALTQLTNHVAKPLTGYELPTLHLVDAPPPAKAGSEDWYAEMIGNGLGKVIDFVALSAAMEAVGVTAAVGSALGGAAKLPAVSNIVAQVAEHPNLVKLSTIFGEGSLAGGIYGAALLPAHNEAHFWRERTINGIGFALAVGAAGTVAQGANLGFKSLGVPLEDEAIKLSAKLLGARAATAALRSGTSSAVKTTTFSLLGQQ